MTSGQERKRTGDSIREAQWEKWKNHLDHTDEEMRKGYHHVVCLSNIVFMN